MRSPIAALLLAAAAGLAQAQDASLLAGAMRVDKDHADKSFAVDVGYTQRLTPWLAVSADYLNEGHPKLHHRDGLGAQGLCRGAPLAYPWHSRARYHPADGGDGL